ncbi:MAG: delta-lactam-biosynthetic de-N-acetylase [Ruminococcaceae bacterium]|nr:delta-lactam-biosynthetic de-N-acetylase [Oscillospiraceae bacterium]
MKNKNILKIILVLILCASTGIASLALPSQKVYNWFFKKTEDGSQPPDAPELSFIKDYDVRWIDRNARDSDKVIYLTFDVGYENGNVERILDALGQYNAKGTFFILENVVNRCPDLVMRMHNEGHTIANHTAKHSDLTAITDKQIFKKQLTDLEKCCREKLGIEISKYFRAPEGRINELALSYLDSLGYKTVFWSFAYADWDNCHQPDPAASVKKILDHTHNGMVLLLHPTSQTNADILPELLRSWTEMGYRFGTMDELFG